MTTSDDQICICRTDQLSYHLLARGLLISIYWGFWISVAAVFVGGIVSLLVGGIVVPGDKWHASFIGFILLVGFSSAFVFVGHTVPPEIVIDRFEIRVGELYRMEARDVVSFSVETTKKSHLFKINLSDTAERSSISFHVARRPETQEKAAAAERMLTAIVA